MVRFLGVVAAAEHECVGLVVCSASASWGWVVEGEGVGWGAGVGVVAAFGPLAVADGGDEFGGAVAVCAWVALASGWAGASGTGWAVGHQLEPDG